MSTSDNKRIAKNTIALYIRMFFTMSVTLYTSRVILEKLDVVDFGLYNAVSGVVGMLTFLNGTLSTGTSRFLTFELGSNNIRKLKSTFSTAFYSHVALALIVVIFLETIGVWFIYNKLVIPPERLQAAVWTFHISILTTFVSITQVPYTSIIIAHERMNIYAYFGIFEALSKLAIVFLLALAPFDRLVFYACLVAGVQISTVMFYRFYCIRNYSESHLEFHFDKGIFKRMLSFSGWSLIANIAEVLNNQGYVVLINMFFQPTVVAAQAIGNQIANAIMQFVGNFRTAINPQIIKLYAAKEYTASQRLTLQSSIYVFDLLLLLGLPAIVLMSPLLHLWLVKVPDYAVVFAQYIVTRQILSNFSAAFYVPMMASGNLKSNSYACVGISFLGFAILYLLLKTGLSVMYVQWIGIFQTCAFSFIVKPYILCKQINYSPQEMAQCILTCVKISAFPITVSILVSRYFDLQQLIFMAIGAIIITASVAISAYVLLNKDTRSKLNIFILKKLSWQKA